MILPKTPDRPLRRLLRLVTATPTFTLNSKCLCALLLVTHSTSGVCALYSLLSPDPSGVWPAPMPVSYPTTVERKDSQSRQICVRHTPHDPVSYAISSSLPSFASSDGHAHKFSTSKVALDSLQHSFGEASNQLN